MIAKELFAGESGRGDEEPGGESGGAQHALLLQEIVTIVIVDHLVGRFEFQAVEVLDPSVIEAADSGDQVACDLELSADRGRLAGPLGRFGPGEQPERLDGGGDTPSTMPPGRSRRAPTVASGRAPCRAVRHAPAGSVREGGAAYLRVPGLDERRQARRRGPAPPSSRPRHRRRPSSGTRPSRPRVSTSMLTTSALQKELNGLRRVAGRSLSFRVGAGSARRSLTYVPGSGGSGAVARRLRLRR